MVQIQKIACQFLLLAALWLIVQASAVAQSFSRFYPETQGTGYWVSEIPGGYAIPARNTFDGNSWKVVQTDIDGNITGEGEPFDGGTDQLTRQPLHNGDMLTTQYIEDDTVLLVQRWKADGALIWSYSHSLGESNQRIYAPWLGADLRYAVEDEQGGLYFSGYFENETDLTMDVYFLKLNRDGAFQWRKMIDRNYFYLEDGFGYQIKPDPGGKCAIVTFGAGITMSLYGTDGALISAFPIGPINGFGLFNMGYGYYTSSTTDPLSGEIDVRLLTLTESGEITNTAHLSALFLPLFDLELLDAYWVMRTMDGNYIAFLTAYNMDTNDLSRKFAVSKFTPDGQIIWLRELKLFEGYFANFYLNELPDSSIALTGDWRIGANGIPKLFFIKIGADGEASPNHLSGVVALDDNENCLFDSTEIRLPGWLLRVENDADQWITQTDTAGRYVAAAGAGDYTLSLLTPNYLWEACDNPRTVTLSTDTLNTEHLSDFSVAPLAICPYMQVEILAPALQSGIENQYVLKYCNAGTALATGATASVEADDLLTLVDASKPYTLADGIIHFDLGNVDIGTCGQIVLHFLAPEAPDLIGQSLCVTARVTPDVVCATGQSPQWSGAILEASALCDGDSIRFEIKNIGTGQSAANLDYIIADDHVIMFSDQLPALQPGVSQQVAVAANGHSWRIEVEQEPFVPEQRRPSLPVEGCAGAGTATSLGLATQLPNNTGSPFSDTECRNITGTSIQPLVQLSANPTGIPPLNLIPQETKIDYMVVFNPVNPATTILIADTLATELDMATFVPGPSSHPYTWHIGSNGVLYMAFHADSMLLESGFVQFSATTRPGLDTGTVILNRAAMSVDGGAAVSTNMVFHTIGATITTGVFDLQNDRNIGELRILPNPASAEALIQIPFAVQPAQSLTLRNALGQPVWQQDVHSSTVTLPRKGLPNGWYVLELREQGHLLARGQLVFCN